MHRATLHLCMSCVSKHETINAFQFVKRSCCIQYTTLATHVRRETLIYICHTPYL